MIDQKARIHIVFFSPTSNAKNIALAVGSRLAALSGLQLLPHDFTLPQHRKAAPVFLTGDLVIFAMPVYAGRLPNLLLPYIESIRGSGALAVPLVVYGNRAYDDALIELRDILNKNDFLPFAAAAFIGEHAFSVVLAANRPDIEDFKKADSFAANIYNKWKAADIKKLSPLFVKGSPEPREYYKPLGPEGKLIDMRKVKPLTNAGCTKCGICVEQCPMGSIDADCLTVSGVCIKCCSCIKKCPAGAKYFADKLFLFHKEDLEKRFIRRAEPEFFL